MTAVSKLQEDFNISTRKLAKIIQINRTTFYNVKRGEQALSGFQLALLLKLADTYGRGQALLDFSLDEKELGLPLPESLRSSLRSRLRKRRRITALTN